MGRYTFRLPDIGEGVVEAEIVAWHVKPGDMIDDEQALVDVMTGKATVDMTSPVAGRVVAVHGAVGERVPVGSPLADIEVGEGDAETEAVAAPPQAVSPNVAKVDAPAPARATLSPALLPEHRGSPLASPATRRRAFERGIALQFVPGTGPGGRITADDLDRHVAGGSAPQVEADLTKRSGVTEVRIVGLRRQIAERMEVAARNIPHISYVEELDLTELEALRRTVNAEASASQPKLTLLPFLMRAVVRVVPDFPQVNAHYEAAAGVLRRHEGVHIGIATQTDGGLMVPVVRHAEARDIWGCARELGRVTAAARDGSATPEELTGSTITLTSLGALGGIAATPIINHPEVAILAPNKLVERPVVRDGQVAIRLMMNLSASFDHRIVDGSEAARFVQAIKRLLERPALLFMERP